MFSASNSSHTNVTELTKGEYEIQLTVTDDNDNNASDSVVITVTQSKFVSRYAVLLFVLVRLWILLFLYSLFL
jgi:hypothetical protein